MLIDFFHLNGQPHDISSAADFLNHFQTTSEMRNVVLRFDPFELQRPQNRIARKRFANVSFSKKLIKNIEFIDCDFEDCLFVGSELINCRFTNCRFVGCNPHRIRIQNTYVDPRSFVKMLNPKSHTNIGINLFEQLLKNYRDSGELDFIPTAEFEYRKWKRLHALHSTRKKLPFSQKFHKVCQLFSLYFLELTTGYGWKIRRFFITSVVIFVFVYAINMLLWDHMNIKDSDTILQNKDPITILYFSIMLMSTLGFNSINPQSELGMVLISLEALLGPVWVSILAAMIIKKAIR